MPVIARSSFAALLLAAAGVALQGQNLIATSKSSPQDQQPYTVELKTTRVQTLADGTTITEESRETRALDSRNRTLFSRTRTVPFGDHQQTLVTGHVDDPVEGTQTTWNSQSMKARVIKLPPEDQRHGCWESDSTQVHMQYGSAQPPRGVPAHGDAKSRSGSSQADAVAPAPVDFPKREDLGTAMIQGMEAHGWRDTTEVPIGAIGNDKPLRRVNESWFAPGLNFPLRQVNEDPQSGRTTTEVVNLDLNEPPLATFQPPNDYKVEIVELRQVPCPEPGMPWQR